MTPRNPRYARWGAWFWVAFCLVAVLCRGVRWDETYEHAQILTGAVVYPEGHPLARYVWSTFSVQTWFSAALLKLSGSAALTCGARNFLFLLATVMPVYLLATVLTGRSRWGHLAALLMLYGIFLEFDGSYPTFVWPELYSNGHIGAGYALLSLWACMTGRPRLAGVLCGFLPAVHLGQFPPVLALLSAGLVYALWRGERAEVRRFCAGFLTALVVSVALFLLARLGAATFPAGGPYAVQGDATAIWKAYTFVLDPHRRFPPANGHIALAGAVLLAFLYQRCTPVTAARWLLAYIVLLGGIVWVIMGLHALLGDRMPFVLISWMPYRLVSHVPPLLLALIAGHLGRRAAAPWVLGLVLTALACVPLVGEILGETLAARYLAHGEWAAFLLFGAALTVRGGLSSIVWLFLCAAALAPWHQFGAACVLAGGALPRLGTHLFRPCRAWFEHRRVVSTIGVCTGLLLLLNQAQHHGWLPASQEEHEMAAALTGEDAFVAGPPATYMCQARLDQPVFFEAATPSLISYAPDLGPVIDAMHRDLYGAGLAQSDPTPWRDTWRGRTPAEWQTLGRKYGITHVIAPEGIPLALPRLTGRLYQVPR